MFFEFREYRLHSGQREKWVQFMEEVVIPFQVSQGMVVVGSFVGEKEEDLYVWIRRFASEEERERLYEAVYKSERWTKEIAPKIPEMMIRERMRVVRLLPTPKSILQ